MTSIRGCRSRGRGLGGRGRGGRVQRGRGLGGRAQGGRDLGGRAQGGRGRGGHGRGRGGISRGARKTIMMGKRNKTSLLVSDEKSIQDSSEPSNSAPIITKSKNRKRKGRFTVTKQQPARTLGMKSPAGLLSKKEKDTESEALSAERVTSLEVKKGGASETHDASSGDTLVVTNQLKRKYHWKIMKKLTGDKTAEPTLAKSPFGELLLSVCSLLICQNFIAIYHKLNAFEMWCYRRIIFFNY